MTFVRASDPGVRAEAVTRRKLLRLVAGPLPPRVAVLTAPAGSGKSTLLAQWADVERRPVAWLTCAAAHLDATLLVHDLARAITAAVGPGPVADALGRVHTGDPLRDLSRLVRALAEEPRPALLVLDDLHRLLAGPPSVDLVVTLVDQLPPGWSVAIAQRQSTSLPTSRWQATDPSFARIGISDLALDADEAGQLLRSIGLAASDELIGDVLDRTEGWPVGVYLAGLSLRADRPLRDGRLVAGDDELIRSYLESEILAGIPAADRDLLVRTAVVREVCGPLAEAITGLPDASERLAALARANLLVMPVDRQERWFRYHGLLADLLQRELEDRHRDPRPLHASAARWFEDHGDTENAILHASMAHEEDQVRRLVRSRYVHEYRAGQVTTVRRWMAVARHSSLVRDPQLSLASAIIAALEGDTSEVARAASAARLDDPDEDVDPQGLDRACLRAVLCPHGPELMREDALRALKRHGDDWSWAPTAWLALGSAERMIGDEPSALSAFEALERTAEGAQSLARLATRAERALAAMNRRAWASAEALLHEDRHFVVDILDPGRSTGTLWTVADARLHVHRGDLRTAHDRLRIAQLGRVHLTWAIPWYAVRVLTEMAPVQLLVGDVGGARASLAQARDILRSRPRLGTLETELEDVSARAMRAPVSRRGGSTLSPAELRLLPLLQTYLSFKEIGARLSISANTVKTEAMTIYGKLGASTRSEAVERAVAAGLLEDPFAETR